MQRELCRHLILLKPKQRQGFENRQTTSYILRLLHKQNWGVMSNYDLCIDAEKFGIEETANMIINAAKKKIK